MNCKICGGNAPLLLTKTLTREDFPLKSNIYKCSVCDFIFSTGMDELDDKDYQKFYEYPNYLRYDPIARREVTENFHDRSHLLVRLIRDYQIQTNNTKGKVLIYGNGVSKALQLSIDAGIDTYACFSHTGSDREINDLTSLADEFDLIVSTEVAEHFVNPIIELHKNKVLLKRGGWTLHSTGCSDRWKVTVGTDRYLEYLCKDINLNAGHVSFYSFNSVEKLANILGMGLRSFNIGDNKTAIVLVKP
jgi:hypothetical protein